jgi:uncharacterized protein (DUF952 family)
MILHIAQRAEWEAARSAGGYQADTLASEGFIHCSTLAQVLGPANAFYRGRTDLVLLVIEPAQLTAQLVYEDSHGNGEHFPHLYGPLNIDAVTRVVPFPPGPDGHFALPAGV